MEDYRSSFKQILKTARILYLWKNGRYRIMTIIPLIVMAISVVISYSDRSQGILSPLIFSGLNIAVLTGMVYPFLIIVIFYDVISLKTDSGLKKKLLSESLSRDHIFIALILLSVVYDLILSFCVIVPTFLTSILFSGTGTVNEEIRFIAEIVPVFFALLLWTSIALLFSSRVKSTFSSLGLSLFTALMFTFFSPILDYALPVDVLMPILHIGTNTPQGFNLISFVTSLLPTMSSLNSMQIFSSPLVVGFNLYPSTGQNVMVYSFNGSTLPFFSCFQVAMVALSPLLVELAAVLLLLWASVRKILVVKVQGQKRQSA